MIRAARERAIRKRYRDVAPVLDEEGRRRLAATEALALGRGGVSLMPLITGLTRPEGNRTALLKAGSSPQLGFVPVRPQPGDHNVGQIAENEPHIDGSIDPGHGQDGEAARRRPRRKLLDGADR